MLKVAHRINTLEQLRLVPANYGIELDIRSEGTDLILQHDPFVTGESFEELLKEYKHQLLILNTKSEGMESRILDLMHRYNIENYFFLDMSFPYLVKYAKSGTRTIAVRYSEYEPLELALTMAGLVDWVWVDCFSRFPLDNKSYTKLKEHFKIALVSPELQGHPVSMIEDYKQQLKGMDIDAVCTKRPDLW
jgi:hypothetical protein